MLNNYRIDESSTLEGNFYNGSSWQDITIYRDLKNQTLEIHVQSNLLCEFKLNKDVI